MLICFRLESDSVDMARVFIDFMTLVFILILRIPYRAFAAFHEIFISKDKL